MSNLAIKPATYEDLWDLPDNMIGQIINGELIAQPRPVPKHIFAASCLNGELFSVFSKNNWFILNMPELHLHGDIFVPDLAGWKKSRMPQLPETAYFELAPDWICEILSPSTARLDRTVKMRCYASAEIDYLWLIDPDTQTLEAYQRQNQQWLLLATFSENEQVSIAPFDAIGFDLSILWG
jgi:Uma2 family endonuclease